MTVSGDPSNESVRQRSMSVGSVASVSSVTGVIATILGSSEARKKAIDNIVNFFSGLPAYFF